MTLALNNTDFIRATCFHISDCSIRSGLPTYKYVFTFHCDTVFRTTAASTIDGHASGSNNCTYAILSLTVGKTCYLKRHKFMTTLRHFSHCDTLELPMYKTLHSLLLFYKLRLRSSNASHYIPQSNSRPTCSYNRTTRYSQDLLPMLPFAT